MTAKHITGWLKTSFRRRLGLVMLVLAALVWNDELYSQNNDTVFVGGKVYIRSNIATVYDKKEYEKSLIKTRTADSLATLGRTLIGDRKITLSYSRSSPTNPCGVIASFSPGSDTALDAEQIYTLTSTSINATNLRWYLNGYLAAIGPQFETGLGTGVYSIMLVADDGTCADTASALVTMYGIAPITPVVVKNRYGRPAIEDLGKSVIACPGGGYLMAGSTLSNPRFGSSAVLIKIKEYGCVEWSKMLEEFRVREIMKMIVTRDSGFVISASVNSSESPYTGIIIRMEKSGDIRWVKSYAENNSPYLAAGLAEAEDGSILAVCQMGIFDGFSILKLDGNGNTIWNRFLKKTDPVSNLFTLPHSIVVVNNDVFVSGYTGIPNSSSEYNHDALLVNLDFGSGIEKWSKSYNFENSSDYFQDMHPIGGQLLINGVRGNYLGGSNLQQVFFYIDFNGNIRRGYRVVLANGLVVQHPFYSNIVPVSNGGYYLFQMGTEERQLQPIYAYRHQFIKTDTNEIIRWQSEFVYSYNERMHQATTTKDEGIAAIGTGFGLLVEVYSSYSNDIIFLRSDSTGNTFSDNCSGMPTSHRIEQILTASTASLTWTENSVKNVQTRNIFLHPAQHIIELRSNCPSYIPKCSYLRMRGPSSVCDLNQTYSFQVKKDLFCGEPIAWTIDPAIQIVTQSDTAVTVKFPSFGNYIIKAALPYSCTPLADSVIIVAAPRLAMLNLGADTSICPRENLVLRAGNDFVSYLWQNGSTDSVFTVTQPGIYSVRVTDSCNNVKSDTITVLARAPLTISLGADRSICLNDSVNLGVQNSFQSYQWSPSYNITSINAPTVWVYPRIDTSYILRVENAAGCYGLDTIRIKVNRAPAINLGNDTSFCEGNSVWLDAGPGFVSYLWSTNSSTQKIMISAAGLYTVEAKDAKDCFARDSLRVMQVYAKPVLSLLKDTVLCDQASRLYSAGEGYTDYTWHDGSKASTFLANSTGKFYVTISDQNGCLNSDTAYITRIQPLPARFLPSDTILCQYEKLELKSLFQFNSYYWSTGALSSSVLLEKSGTYTLRVTDKYGCSGTDTIVVSDKICLRKIVMPNAFTPNGDGKNDVLKPRVFGVPDSYHLIIFNRWGQKVFETKNWRQAWDGTIGNKLQESGAYVYMLTYQFAGESRAMLKGNITLIR